MPDYTGIGAAPFIPDDNAGRYVSYRNTLNASDTWIRGTAYPHPEFDNAAFYLHDAGVVILDEPFVPEVGAGEATHAVLPSLHYIDQFTRKAKSQTLFEAVGYGLEYSRPKVQLGGDTRRKSQQVIVNTNGVYGVHDTRRWCSRTTTARSTRAVRARVTRAGRSSSTTRTSRSP